MEIVYDTEPLDTVDDQHPRRYITAISAHPFCEQFEIADCAMPLTYRFCLPLRAFNFTFLCYRRHWQCFSTAVYTKTKEHFLLASLCYETEFRADQRGILLALSFIHSDDVVL